ncbi:MAG: hypothetical protein IPH77_14320 [Ignavibacteria bacterium]|nr:hypothetical protein [Ignavibacteria bacterium]
MAIRVGVVDDVVEKISYINQEDGKVTGHDINVAIYPAKIFSYKRGQDRKRQVAI